MAYLQQPQGKNCCGRQFLFFTPRGHIDETQGAVDASQEEEICCDEGGSPG